jgi:hypothetical protein
MQLRNCILIALAFDATEQEVNAAHEIIDRISGGIDPGILVSATVDAGTGQVIQSPAAPAGAAAPAANSNVALDAAGFPWDERIHSSNKKFNDKGLWWAKRGVTPALKATVEAELRKTLGSTPAATPTPTPAATPAPTTAALPPMPGASLPPMPGAATPDPLYTNLVQFIAANTQSATNPAGRFTDDYIKQVLTHYGVAEGSLQNLAHRLDLVPQVDAWLRQALTA